MAMIKCPECSSEISEKANVCPKCGYPMDVTKQVKSDVQKKRTKKIIRICSIVFVIGIIIFIIVYYNAPKNVAVRIIKKDLGSDINVESIYYDSQIKGCIVMFSVNGKDDIATIHLKEKTVGYQSVYTELVNTSQTNQILDYGINKYNIFWVEDLVNPNSKYRNWEKTTWKKIK